MSRAELLKKLRDVGYQVAPHRLDYLVGIGLVNPRKDGSGNRVYTPSHMRQVIKAEQKLGRQP